MNNRDNINNELRNYYFTFGSDPAYPYGLNDYVLITAKNIFEAQQAFKEVHPNRPDSDCLNYAFNYSETEWVANDMKHKYYNDKEPAEIISGYSVYEDIDINKEDNDLEY